MRRRYLFLLMVFLVIPLASADFLGIGAAWNNVSSVVRNWEPGNPGVVAVIILVVIFTIMGFTGWGIARHKEKLGERYASGEGLAARAWKNKGKAWWLAKKPFQAAYYGGAAGYWVGQQAYAGGKRGLEWWKIEQDRKKENQLQLDQQIQDKIDKLMEIKGKLREQRKEARGGLLSLEEYSNRLMQMEKELGPGLIKIHEEIDELVVKIKKGKTANAISARQNVERLYQLFTQVAQRHYYLMERLKLAIQQQKGFLKTEETNAKQQVALTKQEKIAEKKEYEDIKDELRAAFDELDRMKQRGEPRKNIRLQQRKIIDIKRRRKTGKRELRDDEKEDVILQKAGGIDESIFGYMDKLQKIESFLANPRIAENKGLAVINTNRLKKQLKLLENNSTKINKAIETLNNMELRNEVLEEKAKKLEQRKEEWGIKEEKILGKQEQRIISMNKNPQTQAA
jgi:hypothetical protein